MPDSRSVEELTLEELEAIVEQRRRIERARRFAEDSDGRRFRPVTVRRIPDQEENQEPRHGLRATRLKNLRDRILLLIEVAAAVALVVVLANSLTSLQQLNEEALQVRGASPAWAPTQELPASSFPPTSGPGELPGGSSPPEPAPPALGIRPQIVAAIPVPTPGPRSPTRIVIPSIKLDWPVVQGDGWEELKQGIGHHIGSANPGERGNLVLSGHNDVYGEPFRELERLEMGQQVVVYAGTNAFRYTIKARRVVLPSDLSVLASSNFPTITLITCTPYRVDTHRLILIGELTQ
jgi:sortase A